MANEQNKAYTLKNFRQILSYYSTLFKNAMYSLDTHSRTPFTPKSWTFYRYDNQGNRTKHVVNNSGYLYGESILKAFKDTSNSIKFSLSTLFINNDDEEIMRKEDLNFNLLNAYASASQSFQKYNESTEEFVDRPEYWFTRGTWYDMLPMCTKGRYILAYHSKIMASITAVEKCRSAFMNYSYTYTTSSGRRAVRRIKVKSLSYNVGDYYDSEGSSYSSPTNYTIAFWNSYLPTLKSEVDRLLLPIWDFGQSTDYPEQNSSTADLIYITQRTSDIASLDKAASIASKIYNNEISSSISTAKSISSNCGKYSAKSSGLSIA